MPSANNLDLLRRTLGGEDFCGVCDSPNPQIKFCTEDDVPHTYCFSHIFQAFGMWCIYGKCWQKFSVAAIIVVIVCGIVAYFC